jgi:hypothetical protein
MASCKLCDADLASKTTSCICRWNCCTSLPPAAPSTLRSGTWGCVCWTSTPGDGDTWRAALNLHTGASSIVLANSRRSARCTLCTTSLVYQLGQAAAATAQHGDRVCKIILYHSLFRLQIEMTAFACSVSGECAGPSNCLFSLIVYSF